MQEYHGESTPGALVAEECLLDSADACADFKRELNLFQCPFNAANDGQHVEFIVKAKMGDAENFILVLILACGDRDAVAFFQCLVEGRPFYSLRKPDRSNGKRRRVAEQLHAESVASLSAGTCKTFMTFPDIFNPLSLDHLQCFVKPYDQ